jgi:hypothetical protein
LHFLVLVSGDDDGVGRAALARHKQPSPRWLGYRFSAPPPTRIWTARLPCSTSLDASPSTLYTTAKMTKRTKYVFNIHIFDDNVLTQEQEGRHHRKYVFNIHIFDHNVLIQEQSTERDTVHLCASRSRRWRYAHPGTFTLHRTRRSQLR